ncbi:uncharacterized protein KNAG_0K00130 [Huiozyma naganishii CBS 8797]|uniref:PA14 domain-containing protein n=1 Tax=Huiozyma naganishii (strain ATCC MYA-139 / BCRC 22969 / CBS 8797 / KCTC 17520 / NBRC 10181 / NCYC 3082 / Yp74L-3) TaxID=1071383 RepID=J7SAQ5_HUIN7|nr:hypothetical protein KNAG_0K00130 [Kazachstania naganishii CBS 8797]CCK72381.1 hypothetical protein KNAG_0K00130 [Kazachstania naganishii CBS 8797]
MARSKGQLDFFEVAFILNSWSFFFLFDYVTKRILLSGMKLKDVSATTTMSLTLFFTISVLLGYVSGQHDMGSPGACLPLGEPSKGFNAKFFSYPINVYDKVLDPGYYTKHYADGGPIGEVKGIIDPNFKTTIPCYRSDGGPTFRCYHPFLRGLACKYWCGSIHCNNSLRGAYWSEEIYGFNTSVSNISMELTGYLLAPETGNYTFYYNFVDDGAFLFVGPDIAYLCCKQDNYPVGVDLVSIGDHYPHVYAASFYLAAGYYYPVKVVFINAWMSGTLDTKLQLPSGKIVQDWGIYVESYENGDPEHCYTTPPGPFASSSHRSFSTRTTSKSSSKSTMNPSSTSISSSSMSFDRTSRKSSTSSLLTNPSIVAVAHLFLCQAPCLPHLNLVIPRLQVLQATHRQILWEVLRVHRFLTHI